MHACPVCALPCACSTALLGDNDGALHLVDLRARPAAAATAAAGRGVTVHSKKINTVHFEPTQEQVRPPARTCVHVQLCWPWRQLSTCFLIARS